MVYDLQVKILHQNHTCTVSYRPQEACLARLNVMSGRMTGIPKDFASCPSPSVYLQ